MSVITAYSSLLDAGAFSVQAQLQEEIQSVLIEDTHRTDAAAGAQSQ